MGRIYRLANFVPKIGKGSQVAGIVIGRIELGHSVDIGPGAVLRGDVNGWQYYRRCSSIPTCNAQKSELGTTPSLDRTSECMSPNSTLEATRSTPVLISTCFLLLSSI